MYGVGGKLLKAVQIIYVDSKACVRIENDISERFSVNVGVRQVCVLPPWYFNLYMDGSLMEMQERTLERRTQLVGVDEEKWEV